MATALLSDERHELDMDSLHILPLTFIPFQNLGLRRARLIKNYHLDSVIEIFNDPIAGSLQADPYGLNKIFDWKGDEGLEDQRIVKSLAALNSYDVYCLRIDLRRLGIEIDQVEHLQLSRKKQEELTDYMRTFTAPLLRQVYGNEHVQIEDWDQLRGLFSAPDRDTALKNLKEMAETIGVEMAEVPAFLEDYGDVFLSLAFYKQCLDELLPAIARFLDAMKEVRSNYLFGQDKALIETCDLLDFQLNSVTSRISRRFKNFDEHSQAMWNDISAESFGRIKTLIGSHHSTVGGVLCGLSLKFKAWEKTCGGSSFGTARHAEFILSHMRIGVDRIKQIEDAAPVIPEKSPTFPGGG